MVRAKLFIVPVLLLATVLSVGRVYFYITYQDIFAGDVADIAYSFLRGIRFDLSTAMAVSAPFLLTVFLPFNKFGKFVITIACSLLALWHITLLGYNLIDIHFFAETQRHYSYDIIYGAGSADTVLKMAYDSFFIEMTVFAIFALVYLCLFGRWFYKTMKSIGDPTTGSVIIKGAGYTVVCIALLGLAVVAIRGGLQDKPLEVNAAFVSDNEAMGNLSLNGVYTTMQALWSITHSREGMRYAVNTKSADYTRVINKIVGMDDEDYNPDYPLYRRFSNNELPKKPLNVVLIIMESWTAKYTKATGGKVSGTPFFDELSKKGLVLTNMFANAQRTFEGAMATVGSFPTWNYKLIGQGGLSFQTRLEPVGTVFRKMGYDTMFIHGANPGSLGLGKLMKRFGFSRHISKKDFTNYEVTDDGTWGIYDEYLFQRAHEEFELAKNPFFALVISLSSHLPFKLPSEKFDIFKDQPGEMRDFLNSMAYSDFALRRFFEKAQAADYYKNTLFVIVGDHVAGYFVKESLHEAYRVPALFISERLGLSGAHESASFQMDIVPSILHLVEADKPFTAWGRSIFSDGARLSMLPRGPTRVLVSEPYFLLADQNGPLGLYDYSENPKQNLVEGKRDLADKLYSIMNSYEAFSESIILNNKVRPPKSGALKD